MLRNALAVIRGVFGDGKWYKCLKQKMLALILHCVSIPHRYPTRKKDTRHKIIFVFMGNQREAAHRNGPLMNTPSCGKYWWDRFLQWPKQRKTTYCTERRQHIRLWFVRSSERLWEKMETLSYTHKNGIRMQDLLQIYFLSGDQIRYYFQH